MNVNFWLLKTSRISAYVLIVLMLVYLITGFSMIGLYDMHRIVDKNFAIYMHVNLFLYLIIFLVLHCGIDVYFALKRWKIIK